MKKIILLMLIGAIATTAGFAQTQPAVQSIFFTGPTQWIPGTEFSLDTNLTFAGYNALGLSYWLEVPNAVAPFLQIIDVQYFPPWGSTPPTFPIMFTDTAGARAGYRDTNRDLGASTNPGTGISPGTYIVNRMTFTLGPAAPSGTYTMFTTSLAPRISAITDSLFGDNNIIPPGQFVFTIVPEPSTLALVALGTVAFGLVFYRRRKTSR